MHHSQRRSPWLWRAAWPSRPAPTSRVEQARLSAAHSAPAGIAAGSPCMMHAPALLAQYNAAARAFDRACQGLVWDHPALATCSAAWPLAYFFDQAAPKFAGSLKKASTFALVKGFPPNQCCLKLFIMCLHPSLSYCWTFRGNSMLRKGRRASELDP